MIEKLRIFLGIKKSPTEREVFEALDLVKWRTKSKIHEIINSGRPMNEQYDAESLLGYYANKVLRILRDLEMDGLAVSKNDDDFYLTDITNSDDPKIRKLKDVEEVIKLRKIRGNHPQRIYRLAHHDLTELSTDEIIEYSIQDAPDFQPAET